MKYVVLSPENKMMCFNDTDQVEEYCMAKDNFYLDQFCKDQSFEYENMTPTEIGYAYAEIGATTRGCRIFRTDEVIKAMVEEGIEPYLVVDTKQLFNNRNAQNERDCPGYLEDLLSQMTPIPVSELSEGVYTLQNIDGPSTERGQSGI